MEAGIAVRERNIRKSKIWDKKTVKYGTRQPSFQRQVKLVNIFQHAVVNTDDPVLVAASAVAGL